MIVVIIIGYSLSSNFQIVHSFWQQLETSLEKLPKRSKHKKTNRLEDWDRSGNLFDQKILRRFSCPIRGDWIVTSPFGRRKIFGKYQYHKGIDLISKRDEGVYAAFDGVLVFRGRKSGYGNIVILKHSKGITTRYAHLSRFAYGISEGQDIRQHQRLGRIGNTGRTNGKKHLHFEIRKNGEPINPRPFLKKW